MYSSVQSWQMRRHEAREFGPFRLLSARRRHAWHGDEPIPRDSRASRSGIGCKRRQSSVGDSEVGTRRGISVKGKPTGFFSSLCKQPRKRRRRTLDKIREDFDEQPRC